MEDPAIPCSDIDIRHQIPLPFLRNSQSDYMLKYTKHMCLSHTANARFSECSIVITVFFYSAVLFVSWKVEDVLNTCRLGIRHECWKSSPFSSNNYRKMSTLYSEHATAGMRHLKNIIDINNSLGILLIQRVPALVTKHTKARSGLLQASSCSSISGMVNSRQTFVLSGPSCSRASVT